MYFRFLLNFKFCAPPSATLAQNPGGWGPNPAPVSRPACLPHCTKQATSVRGSSDCNLKSVYVCQNFSMAVKLAAFSLPKRISCMFLANSFVTILPFSNFQFCISAKMVQSKKNDFIAAQTHILLQPYFNPATQILTGIKCLPLH